MGVVSTVVEATSTVTGIAVNLEEASVVTVGIVEEVVHTIEEVIRTAANLGGHRAMEHKDFIVGFMATPRVKQQLEAKS